MKGVSGYDIYTGKRFHSCLSRKSNVKGRDGSYDQLCVHEQPAYCVAACPFKADTKEMLFYAAKGNFKKALAIYEKITPFPMILCNGCTAPCEEKCRLCELGDGISIREVERAIVRYGEPGKRSSVFRIRKKKKAVIFGSGLFPLFLAGELEKKMYPATIYCQEKDYEAILQQQLRSFWNQIAKMR